MFSRKTAISFLIISTVFSLPLVFTWRLMDSFYLPKRIMLSLYVCSIAVIWICSQIRDIGVYKPAPVRVTPINRTIFLFVCWSAFTIIKSPNLSVSADKYLFLFESVFLFFAALYFIDNQKLLYRLISAMIAAGVIVSVIGILQYYGLDIKDKFAFTAEQISGDKYKVFSTLGHPNFMGAFLITVMPVSFALMAINNGVKKLLYLSAFVVISFCLYISRSKSAWLGCSISFTFLFTGLAFISKAYIKNGKRKIIFTSAAIIIFFVTALSLFQYISPKKRSPFEEVKKTLSPNFSANRARLIIWQTSLMMIKEHPVIGFGYGTYNLFYQHYQGKFLGRTKYLDYYLEVYKPGKEAHNDYLQIFAETGAIGIILFLCLIAGFLRNGISSLRMSNNIQEKTILMSIISSILAVLGQSLASFPLQQIPPAVNMWVFMGLVMGTPFRKTTLISSSPSSSREEMPEPSLKMKKTKTLLQLIVIAAAVSFCVFRFRPVYGSNLHIDAYNYMIKKNYLSAASTLETALQWYPGNADMHLMLGAAYYNMGQYTKAVREYEISYRFNPDYMILYNIGLIKEKMGDEKGSEKYFLKAIELHPDLAEAYWHLADIYKKRGEEQISRKYGAKWTKYDTRRQKK